MAWRLFHTPTALHIAPEGDIREHEFIKPCWCSPRVDHPLSDNIIHRAFLPIGMASDDSEEVSADPPMTAQ